MIRAHNSLAAFERLRRAYPNKLVSDWEIERCENEEPPEEAAQ